jgi:hypothetical protein
MRREGVLSTAVLGAEARLPRRQSKQIPSLRSGQAPRACGARDDRLARFLKKREELLILSDAVLTVLNFRRLKRLEAGMARKRA